MNARINSISYFDYTRKIGHLQSLKQFTSLEMKYFATALSTETIRVNAEPISFLINEESSERLRELVISKMDNLTAITKELAVNSPRYITISYADGTESYFKYNEEYDNIFSLAKNCEKPDLIPQEDNPYLIKKDVFIPYHDEELRKENLGKNESNKSVTSPTYTRTKLNEPITTSVKPNEKTSWGRFSVILIVILVLIGFAFWSSIKPLLKANNNDSSTDYYVDLDGNVYKMGADGTPSLEEHVESSSESNLKPKSKPLSGTILYGNECYDGSEITITASGGESCLVKLKTSSGITRLGFYVRAGETITVGVPAEYLYVYFASGDTWYGTEDLFGESTSYSMDDEALDFTEYTWEYTLYPVSNGNFSGTPIDESEF